MVRGAQPGRCASIEPIGPEVVFDHEPGCCSPSVWHLVSLPVSSHSRPFIPEESQNNTQSRGAGDVCSMAMIAWKGS
jgi:hypothetical protein